MKIYSLAVDGDPHRLPCTSLDRDWFSESFGPPVRFAFGLDHDSFHFLASRDQCALCHPDSRPGAFQAELWKYDVAEFFLSAPSGDHYLEFNLAPNGGWWSCQFGEPLARLYPDDRPIPEVRTDAQCGPQGWAARASLPLAWLREHLDFGPTSHLNATFILDSPAQRFLTASPLGSGDPAFHRPEHFPTVEVVPL